MSWWHRGLLAALVVAAVAVRITGFDRGGTEDGAFRHYHPDERTLISASLALDSALDPPLTAYGTFPMYLARTVLAGATWATGEVADLDSARGRRISVVTMRVVAVLLSLMTVLMGWSITRSAWGESAALLAVALTAAAPLAIQQAHFYTVDVVFALLALLSLAAVLWLDARDGVWKYVATGALIGTAAATRLNGVLTALVLVVDHLQPLVRGRWRPVADYLRRPGLWCAGLAALGTLLLWQPYLLVSPELMSVAAGTDDFAYSVAIARGEILRPWSLADTHTIPFLHYWSHLFPRGVGWPMSLLLLAGWARAALMGDRKSRLVALWCALFFLSVGGLHTKHVRYLLPLLAPLGMLAAVLLVELCQRRRWRPWAMAVATLCAVYTWAYGVAFSGIYQVADARTAAGQWIDQNVPEGSAIVVERGGFSMRGTFSGSSFREHDLNTTTVFATRGYLSCGAAATYLAKRMTWVDWVAITDVNRHRQYTSAPEFFPVLASFYQNLLAGDLGFDTVQRFKVYPEISGWTFHDDDAEPSFLGFDHPAVHVLRSAPDRSARLTAWHEMASSLPACPDSLLEVAVSHMRTDDLDNAESALASLGRTTPRLASLLRVMVHERRGEKAEAHAELTAFSDGVHDKSLAASLLPWAAAASLVELSLLDEAARVLELGWQRRHGLEGTDREIMAKSYMYVAALTKAADRADLQERICLMAADLWESPVTLNPAADLVQARGDDAVALALWAKSLQLDDNQVGIHLRMASTSRGVADPDRAAHHLSRFVELTVDDPQRTSVEDAILAAQILHALGAGDVARSYLGRLADLSPGWSTAIATASSSLSNP